MLAWLAQGAVTVGTALLAWFVWRSPVRFALKAATLSAATLIASPYAFAYDMAATVIPAAFLVRDQLSYGALGGERAVALALFASSLAVLIAFGDRPGGITFGSAPVGIFVALTLLGMISRRAINAIPDRSHVALRPFDPERLTLPVKFSQTRG